jgi:alpha-beta hydrolase superfamily lysophospholipase
MDTPSVAAPSAPIIPRATMLAWRLAPYADSRRIDPFLRLFGARLLPVGVSSGRLSALSLPTEITSRALRRVRSVRDWDVAWTWAAQRFLGESRVHQRAGDEIEAALAQRHAALSYHLAAMLVCDDPRKIRALRASTSTLYARSLATLRPTVRRVSVPWRATSLPAFLALPDAAKGPVPLAVLLNGTSTSKEETLMWGEAFLARGLAVLALDWPGSGESALHVAPTADCDDFTDGVVALTRSEPGLATARLALVGFSLGGAVAALAAAHDRRVEAVVAVTPPYDARRWYGLAQPLLRQHLATLTEGSEGAARLAARFAVSGIVGRTRCPVLVIGAGRDVIVPPEEAIRYCLEAGERGTLLWYPHGGHGLYDEMPDWTAQAAGWLTAIFAGTTPSTWVDGLMGRST